MMTQMWEYSSANTHSQLQKYYPWFLAKPLKKTYERLILFPPPPCIAFVVWNFNCPLYDSHIYNLFLGARSRELCLKKLSLFFLTFLHQKYS